MKARGTRLPGLDSNCGLPCDAAAYSINFTGFLKTSALGLPDGVAVGQTQPQVSTLNDLTGTIVANAGLVPGGTDGAIAAYVTDDTDLMVDADGYFAPPGTGGLSFYALTPCRVIDTRQRWRAAVHGRADRDMCQQSLRTAGLGRGLRFNATMLPQGPLDYLTLWPDRSNSRRSRRLTPKMGHHLELSGCP